jgi:hypothetical protein
MRGLLESLVHHVTGMSLLEQHTLKALGKKINSALNTFENFAKVKKIIVTCPLDVAVVSDFISWVTFSRNLSPSTIISYLSHLKLVHRLRGLDYSGVSNFICKTQ